MLVLALCLVIIWAHRLKAEGMKTETKKIASGCNGALFGDHSLLEAWKETVFPV